MNLDDQISSSAISRPLLLGHRGARRSAPENSFAAFDKSLADGCDGFEFDVRLTSDARCVICHGPRLASREIARSTLSQLAAACKKKVPERDGAHESCCLHESRCLEDVLGSYAGRAFLNVELKVPGLEEATVELLARFPNRRGAVVSSFLPEVLRKLGALDPAVPLGFIFREAAALRQWELMPVSHLMPHRSLVDAVAMSDFHAAGKQVFVWTVNNAREMRKLAELGADGLISDDTRLLSDVFRGKQSI